MVSKRFIIVEALKRVFSKNTFLIFACLCFSFSSAFVAGFFSQEVDLEKNAEYIANAIVDSVPTKDLLSIAIEAQNGGSLPDSESEFLHLYGVFRQEKITFASGYNMTKESQIFFDELHDDINLAAVYIGSTTGSTEYKGHYKDVTYPVELMFPLKRYDSVSMQTAIISETQAEKLLDVRRPELKNNSSYSEKDFESLIGEPLVFEINGDKKLFVIQDIFYEKTYYSEGLKHTVGDFFYTSYYFPKTVNKQNSYFMCTYPYENMFFMNYIREMYGERNYDLKCVTTLLQKDVDESKITSFYSIKEGTRQMWKSIFIIVAFFSLLFFIFFLFFKRIKIDKWFVTFYVFFSLLPYFFFFLLFSTTQDIIYFSGYSCKIHTFLQLLNISFFSVYYAISRLNIFKIVKDKYYELHI